MTVLPAFLSSDSFSFFSLDHGVYELCMNARNLNRVLLEEASIFAAFDISHGNAVALSAQYSAKSILLQTVPRFKGFIYFNVKLILCNLSARVLAITAVSPYFIFNAVVQSPVIPRLLSYYYTCTVWSRKRFCTSSIARSLSLSFSFFSIIIIFFVFVVIAARDLCSLLI